MKLKTIYGNLLQIRLGKDICSSMEQYKYVNCTPLAFRDKIKDKIFF